MLTVAISKRNKLQNIIVLTPKDGYKSKAELAGGIILILMGVKILLEHLGFLG